MAGPLHDHHFRVRDELPPDLRLLHRNELVFLAPHDKCGHFHAMKVPWEFGIRWVLPEQTREARRFTVSRGDEVGIGFFRKMFLYRLEIRNQHREDLFARNCYDIDGGVFGDVETIRCNEYQLLDPMTVFACKFRGEIASHRESDKMHCIDLQGVEQLEIVHDVVMDIRERGIVAGLAKTRMVRNNDAVLVRPGPCKIETVYCTGAMEHYERFPFAGGVYNSLYAIDGQFLACKLAHWAPPDGRSLGITRSANNVRFFTAFQCGMSETCMTQLM